jgi:hypothetical protein
MSFSKIKDALKGTPPEDKNKEGTLPRHKDHRMGQS